MRVEPSYFQLVTKPRKEGGPQLGDRIEVPLDPADLEVVASDVVGGILEVTVQESFPRACHHCGPIDVVGHGVNSRTTRFKSVKS